MLFRIFAILFLFVATASDSQSIYNLQLLKNYNVSPAQDTTGIGSNVTSNESRSPPGNIHFGILKS